MASLHLEVVTPDRLVMAQDVDYVAIPGLEGEFGVLPGHVPFLSALKIGALHFNCDGKAKYVSICGGFCEISDNNVSVLAESAELSDEIDFNRAERALERARERLKNVKEENIDMARAMASLQRAQVRLSLRGY